MPVLTNDRYEDFALRVALGNPYTCAYIDAGFESKSRNTACIAASRLASNPEVKARIEELQTEFGDVIKRDHGVTRQWLVATLERNIRIAYGQEPYMTVLEPVRDNEGKVKKDEHGNILMGPTQKFKYEPAAANKSLELLGKLIGEFKNGLELTGAAGGPIQTKLTVEFVGVVADAISKGAASA